MVKVELTGFVAPSEAARRLGVSVEQVRVWMKSQRIQSVRTPLGRIIPVQEVERVAAERATAKKRRENE